MAKIKTYKVTKEVTDSRGNVYKIFVYGEVAEDNALEGVEVRRVNYQHGSKKVVSASTEDSVILPLGDNCSPVKKLNFGFAICAPEDEFNEQKGIEIARKRFSKSPITTQDCRFLKKDMVEAILNQTAEYVAEHELKNFFDRREKDNELRENFHDGEIVTNGEYGESFAIKIGEDGSVGRYSWVFYRIPFGIQFKYAPPYYPKFPPRETRKATDEERAEIQNYLREHYHNQWDENNKKFIKA